MQIIPANPLWFVVVVRVPCGQHTKEWVEYEPIIGWALIEREFECDGIPKSYPVMEPVTVKHGPGWIAHKEQGVLDPTGCVTAAPGGLGHGSYHCVEDWFADVQKRAAENREINAAYARGEI